MEQCGSGPWEADEGVHLLEVEAAMLEMMIEPEASPYPAETSPGPEAVILQEAAMEAVR